MIEDGVLKRVLEIGDDPENRKQMVGPRKYAVLSVPPAVVHKNV